MKLEQFNTAVYNAVEKAYEIQKEHMKQKEELQNKVRDNYLTQKYADERLNELKQKSMETLNNTNNSLLNISREVLETELQKISDSEQSITIDVYSELKLLSEIKPTRELYQRYIDKYKDYPLAVNYIIELGARDVNNLIVLNKPQDKREALNLLVQRLENYLIAFNKPTYKGYLPQLEMYTNGVLTSIKEDYQNYLNLFNK